MDEAVDESLCVCGTPICAVCHGGCLNSADLPCLSFRLRSLDKHILEEQVSRHCVCDLRLTALVHEFGGFKKRSDAWPPMQCNDVIVDEGRANGLAPRNRAVLDLFLPLPPSEAQGHEAKPASADAAASHVAIAAAEVVTAEAASVIREDATPALATNRVRDVATQMMKPFLLHAYFSQRFGQAGIATNSTF